MDKETNMSEVVAEIKNSNEEDLKKVIEEWFEKTRTQSMKIGASYISAAIYGVIEKNIKKKAKVSLRDYKRMTDEILQIISVQLTRQNDSEEEAVEEQVNTVEENDNDRTTE